MIVNLNNYLGSLLNLSALKKRSLLMINENYNEDKANDNNNDEEAESVGADDDDDNDNNDEQNNDDQQRNNNTTTTNNNNEDPPLAIIVATIVELYAFTEQHVSIDDQKRIVINFLKKLVKRYDN